MRVAAVGADDKVVLKPVTVGRNLGNRVEIDSGLSLSDRLVDSPLDRLRRECGECRRRRRDAARAQIDSKRQSCAEEGRSL